MLVETMSGALGRLLEGHSDFGCKNTDDSKEMLKTLLPYSGCPYSCRSDLIDLRLE